MDELIDEILEGSQACTAQMRHIACAFAAACWLNVADGFAPSES